MTFKNNHSARQFFAMNYKDVTPAEVFEAATRPSPPPWHHPGMWVGMLATAFTLLITEEDDTEHGRVRFTPFSIKGQSQFFLVRWLHRCTDGLQPTDKKEASTADAIARADPLTYKYGNDRLIWARLTRNKPHIAGEASPPLDQCIRAVKRLHGNGATNERVAKELDKVGAGRYRRDDAYSGVAFCDVQSIDAQTHLVDVTQVPEAARTTKEDKWDLSSTTHGSPAWSKGFSDSQGDLLSSWHQFRLNTSSRIRTATV